MPIVITSLGAVKELVDAVHSYGGLVFHDVTTRRHAEKAAEAGVDGLIAVAAGAGGHAGTWSPFALIAEIRQFFDKTLLLAGCLNHGHEILAAQLLGADLAYFGTRFIGTTESHAPDAYKEMLLTARAADIMHTPAVSGVPASFMRQSLEAAGFDLAALQGKGEVNFGAKLKPMSDEAKAWKTVWSAGQGVGEIDDLPSVDQVVARLDAEYRKAQRAGRTIDAGHAKKRQASRPLTGLTLPTSIIRDKDASAMSDTRYKIVFDGALLPGVEITTAKLNLADLFKSNVEAIERLFTGRPVALKRDLSHPDAKPTSSAEERRDRRAHRSRNSHRAEPR